MRMLYVSSHRLKYQTKNIHMKIQFTKGTYELLEGNYYTVILFNNDKRVYSATMPFNNVVRLLQLHPNKLINTTIYN